MRYIVYIFIYIYISLRAILQWDVCLNSVGGTNPIGSMGLVYLP